MSKISILIPCYNEEKYISSCLDSIINSDYTHELMEVMVLDGMSTDQTRNIVKDYSKRFEFIKLIDNKDKIVPKAMNLGIKMATGEHIIRLDAHSSYPKDYFSKLVEQSIKLDADNVGTVCITDVKNKTKKSLAIKKVLSNKFGVGNSLFRTGVTEVQEVDTVPFGCFKKETFEKYGLYDERLIRNQDIELNKRIVNNGGKVYLIPDVKLTYFAREDYRSLYKNNFSNGMWNVLTAFYTKRISSLSLRHFIPLFFILSLFVPLLLTTISTIFIVITLLSFVSHTLLMFLISLREKDDETTVLNIFYAFLVLHYSYGLGSLWAFVKILKIKLIG